MLLLFWRSLQMQVQALCWLSMDSLFFGNLRHAGRHGACCCLASPLLIAAAHAAAPTMHSHACRPRTQRAHSQDMLFPCTAVVWMTGIVPDMRVGESWYQAHSGSFGVRIWITVRQTHEALCLPCVGACSLCVLCHSCLGMRPGMIMGGGTCLPSLPPPFSVESWGSEPLSVCWLKSLARQPSFSS